MQLLLRGDEATLADVSRWGAGVNCTQMKPAFAAYMYGYRLHP
jgi:hypothetical protein